VSVFALDELVFPYAWRFTIYRYPLKLLIEKLGVCLIIISFIRFVLSLVDFIALILEQKALLTLEKKDDQLIVFFRDFLKVLIGLAGILLLIKVGFNQNIGTLLTGLSIVGAALALAAKESLENLIASIIIFFDKPFYVGDTLKVNNITGTVERIGSRSTRIRTFDKTLVTVPNKQMVDSIVDNYSMRSERRAEIRLELSLSTSLVNMEKFSEEVKMKLSEKKTIVSSSVFFSELSKNGIIVTVEYFTVPFTMDEFNTLKQEIILFLKNTVDDLEISLASATPDINIIQGDTGPVPPPSKTII
jgi:MscS family membrane protein